MLLSSNAVKTDPQKMPHFFKGPGVNFINILLAAFMRKDPESAKQTENLTVFSGLLVERL